MPIITEEEADASTPVLPQTPGAVVPRGAAPADNSATPDNPLDKHIPADKYNPDDDLPAGGAPVVSPVVAPAAARPTPGLGEISAAAFAQSNILGSVLEKQAFGGYASHPDVPGYDPYASDGADIKGYEDYADRFTASNSPAQTQVIKNLIDAENADKDTLARAGWAGYAASMASGAVDPISLTLMLIPGIGEMRVASAGRAAIEAAKAAGSTDVEAVLAGRAAMRAVPVSRASQVGGILATNVAAGEAQAGAVAANSQTGSYSDGILPRIGANALLSGILGGIATRVPRTELDATVARTNANLQQPISTAGAAQVANTTLADESVAKGGRAIARSVGQVSPVTRILTNSQVVEARQLAQQLVDPGFMLEKNLQGVATPTSVEMRVNQIENVRNSQLFQKLDAEFTDYKQGGGELSKSEFSEAVADAMRNGDQHDIPQVRNVAQFARPMFAADHAALVKAGVIPDGENVVGAPSYFPRVYDQAAIMANRTDIEQRLTDWFTNNPKPVEPKAEALADEPAEAPSGPSYFHGTRSDFDTFDVNQNTSGDFVGHYFADSEEGALKWANIWAKGEGEPRAVEVKLDIKNSASRGDVRAAKEELGPDWTREQLTEALKAKGFDSYKDENETVVFADKQVHRAGVVKPVEPAFTEPQYREPAEVKAAVYDVLDKIQGTVRGVADVGEGVKNPSVVKARTLDVPDSILQPYLSSDFEHVMAAYNRSVLPHIEMHRTFGSTDLADQFQKITDAYHAQIERAGSDEAKAALVKQQAQDMADLQLLRDRVLNRTGPRGNESLNLVRAAQLARSFNYLRMLGGQTASAFADVGRLVTRYGLFNTGRRLTAFLGSSTARDLSKADAQRMGTALDVVLHTRMHTLDGIGDELAGSQLGRRMQNATARFTKLTGIAHWDTMMRVLSSQLEQDALFRLVIKGNVSTFERGKLAAHGIGDAEIGAIRDQWLKHGSDENGLTRARTELWTDKDAAARVEQAVQRAGSSNAFFVGKGDLPGFANSQLGKMLIQFKAFAISSVNRLAIPLAQGLAHRDVMAANGLASMLALGALSYYVKELAAGRKPDLSPDALIPNAVQRSGILTFLPDLYDPVAGTLHLPRFAKFQDLNPLETMAGPTFGTGAALLDTVRRLTKGNISAADMHKLRQLMPYQNLFYFTRLINMLEGKASDAIGAKNATGQDAVDYLNPAKDQPPKAKTDKNHLFGVEAIPNAF